MVSLDLFGEKLLKSFRAFLCRRNRNIVDIYALGLSKPAIRLAAFIGTLPVDVALEARTALFFVILIRVVLVHPGGVLLLLLFILIPIVLNTAGIVIYFFIDVAETVRIPSPIVAGLGSFRDRGHLDQRDDLLLLLLRVGG